MSFLRVLRALLFVVLVVAAFAFTMFNAGARVELIRLPFLPDRTGMLLVEVMLYPLVLGLLAGFAVSILKLVELQTQLRTERRSRNRIQGELTALRNLPLDEAEEESAASGSPS
jgi:type III secretory pathway component EscU